MRSLLRTVTGATLCVALGASPALADETYTVAGYTVALPAKPLASIVAGGRLYVALGDAGVAVFEVGGELPRLVEVRAVGGEAFEVVVLGGRPWAMVNEAKAVPLGPAVEVAPGAEAAPGVASEARGGNVVSAGAGSAVIERGLSHGLKPGDTVRVYSRVPVEVEGIEGGADGLYREELSGIGTLRVVGAGRSQVALARGGRAMPGDRFELAPGAEQPLVSPPRLDGLVEAGFEVKPFLAVGTLGVGTINEAWVSYIGKGPWFADLRLQPLTAGWSRAGNTLGVSTIATGGYDNPFFAIGLGLGVTAANTGITAVGRSLSNAEGAVDDSGSSYSVRFEEVNRAGSIAQAVRLGARDGMHLEVRNTFVLGTVEEYQAECLTYEGGEEGDEYCIEYGDEEKVGEFKEIRWGATQGRLVIPVMSLTDLVFEGGGGATGYVYGNGGVQTWVRGNGDRGSLGLRVAAGYGYLAGRHEDEYVEIAGPLLSFGMRWRL